MWYIEKKNLILYKYFGTNVFHYLIILCIGIWDISKKKNRLSWIVKHQKKRPKNGLKRPQSITIGFLRPTFLRRPYWWCGTIVGRLGAPPPLCATMPFVESRSESLFLELRGLYLAQGRALARKVALVWRRLERFRGWAPPAAPRRR